MWTTGELCRLLEVAAEHRLLAFYRLAAYTGARRGELLHLRWSQVDIDGREITLSGSTAGVEGQGVEGTTKGGRSRVVAIDGETAAVLREHRKRQAAERPKVGPLWTGPGDLVFAAETGSRCTPTP